MACLMQHDNRKGRISKMISFKCIISKILSTSISLSKVTSMAKAQKGGITMDSRNQNEWEFLDFFRKCIVIKAI